MSVDEGKLNPGIDYQFEIITYTAACLSENLLKNKTVADYQIYTNQKIPSFDDIIVKVKYKSEEKPFVYLGQIRRYIKPKINFNSGKDRLQQYLEKILEITNNNDRESFLRSLLEDVPEENIEFWFISNSFLSNFNNYPPEDPLKSPIVLYSSIYCYLEPDTAYKSIFPLRNGVACYKLVTKRGQRLPYHLRKFYVFLNQPDHNQVASSIVNLYRNCISIATANNMINFVNAYLKQAADAKLTKYIFETHLLKLRLSLFIVSPTEAFEIDTKLASSWNKLLMEFDITLASSEMKSYIFGCIWQEIRNLYYSEFDWNDTITNNKGIIEKVSIQDKFEQLVQDRGIRHWLDIPDTIMDLLIEMWKCDYLPLVLSKDTDIATLDKYKHLGKRFVILHRRDTLLKDISHLGLRVFTSAADIHEIELAKGFLESIIVSLQGRESIELFSILNGDIDLMKEFTCDQLLYLIRERKNLLSRDEDSNTARIKDEDGNDLCIEKDKVVPIIGKCFATSKMYIDRYLRKPTVAKTICCSKTKVICFLTEHLNSIDWSTNNHYRFLDEPLVNIVSRVELQIEQKEGAFIGIKDEHVEGLWSQFSSREHPLLHIKVENGTMILLKYRNCPDLSSHVSYNGPKFNADSFFEETSTGITVITGETGSGKSTFLRSLFSACDKHSFALFCDLKDYRHDLYKHNVDLFTNPINFILKKEEEQLILSNKQYSKHHLNFLHKFLDKTKQLILFLDSFDEVIPECEGQVLNFIRVLINSNRRCVIASRLVTAYILGNSLEVTLLKIDTLSKTDIKKYLNNEIPEKELNKYPLEFRENPLFLNFLITLYRENALPSVITSSTLYNAIIEKHIERFYNAKDDFYTSAQYEYWREAYLEVYKKLALLEIFDDTVTAKLNLNYEELRKKCTYTDKLKLGLIVQFNDEGPLFLHRTIAEFLVAEWLTENIDKDYGKSMYVMLLKDYREHIRYLLDDILCRNLPLHQAVLQKDLPLVKNLCSADEKYLKDVDKLNRSALDIAAIYFSILARDNRSFLPCNLISNQLPRDDRSFLILEEIVHHMILKKNDLSVSNSITKKHWTDYLRYEFQTNFFSFPNVTHTPEMFFFYQNKIEDGIDWHTRRNQLDAAMRLFKKKVHLSPTCFSYLLLEIITKLRMDLLSQIIELQNCNNMELDILRRACKNLLPVTEVSKCISLKIEGGFTAVHIACIYGSANVLRELVNLDAEVNAVDDFQLQPLYYAIAEGSSEIVTILMKLLKREENHPSGSSHEKICPYKKILPNYLHNSLKRNFLNNAKILLDNGFDINDRNEKGRTVLHIAIKNYERTDSVDGHTSAPVPGNDDSNINRIKFLLERKADCNIQDDDGKTPLHIAVENERLDVTEMLLNHGAKVNVKTTYSGHTPLIFATERRNSDLVKLLLQYYADVNLENDVGETILFAMSGDGCEISLEYNIAEALVNAGANVNHKSKNECTALHVAALNKRENLVRIFLHFGADVNMETKNGNTALMIATLQNHYEITTLLLEKGSKVNHQDNNGNTALHNAVKNYFFQNYKKENLSTSTYKREEGEVDDTVLLNAIRTNNKLPFVLLQNVPVIEMLLTGESDCRNEIEDADLRTTADVLKILLDNDADVNAVNKEDQTALDIVFEYKIFLESLRKKPHVQQVSESVRRNDFSLSEFLRNLF